VTSSIAEAPGLGASRLARWDRVGDIVAAAVDVKAVGRLVGRPL
jgi:hypothetical protein